MAYGFANKQRTLSFGAYPSVSLADARKARDEAKAMLAKGIDPGRQKRIDKIRAADASENTFDAIAADLREKLVAEGRAASTMARHDRLLKLASADFGSVPIGEITAAEVLTVLRKMEKRGKHVTVGKMRVSIGMVFRHGIATGRASVDPTVPLSRALVAPTVTHRAAITDRKGFGALLRAIWQYEGQAETRAGLQLCALLYPRSGELRHAEWAHIDFDKATWVIPPENAKMRRQHIKPLPPQAIAILRDLKELTGSGRLLFPSIRSVKRPMSDVTLLAALRRMGFTKQEMSVHGFRSSAAVLIGETGKWAERIIDIESGRIEPDRVKRAYHRGDHLKERVAMQTFWANECDAMRLGATVIPLRA
jgi:integrase